MKGERISEKGKRDNPLIRSRDEETAKLQEEVKGVPVPENRMELRFFGKRVGTNWGGAVQKRKGGVSKAWKERAQLPGARLLRGQLQTSQQGEEKLNGLTGSYSWRRGGEKKTAKLLAKKKGEEIGYLQARKWSLGSAPEGGSRCRDQIKRKKNWYRANPTEPALKRRLFLGGKRGGMR